MLGFQRGVRIVLLDAKRRLISLVDVTKGTLDESLAHPREIFRTVIANAAYAFVLVHNHPSGVTPNPVLRRTERRVPSGEALSDAA